MIENAIKMCNIVTIKWDPGEISEMSTPQKSDTLHKE